uniref:Uncharacterized protein n=1 Tax=Macaca fascicularis TaxID=9541 RepID=A0A7N9CY55_MACFA
SLSPEAASWHSLYLPLPVGRSRTLLKLVSPAGNFSWSYYYPIYSHNNTIHHLRSTLNPNIILGFTSFCTPTIDSPVWRR